MEWQRATRYHEAPFAGEMINFHSRTLDLLVTPDHQILVTTRPRRMVAESHGTDWLIPADQLIQRFSSYQCIPVTATNTRPDLERFVVPRSDTAYNEYVVFDPAIIRPARKHLGIRLVDVAARAGCSYGTAQKIDHGGTCRLPLAERVSHLLGDIPFTAHSTKFGFTEMTGDDFSAFMGAWLAEGCVSWTSAPVKRPCIYISQERKSRGFHPYWNLLARILGREPGYTGKSFFVRHTGLVPYLEQFGYARDKFLPPEILNLSARQATIFWHYYWLGDGDAARPRMTTASLRMANDLQVLAMRMGKWATVQVRTPKGDTRFPDGHVQKECNRNLIYKVALHEIDKVIFKAKRQSYVGSVYGVAVPNQTLYVRRNGKPAWAGSA